MQSFPIVLRHVAAIALSVAATCGWAADYPKPTEADFVATNFKFTSGETLPEVRIHYRTFGRIARDASGHATNVVLIGHGTGGSGASLVDSPTGNALFAAELLGKGQPLDAERYFIVVPDGLGHGKSSKPSDGLHGRFPRYGYRDMVEAQYRQRSTGCSPRGSRSITCASRWARRWGACRRGCGASCIRNSWMR
jgi:homoserine O-acetyltransferase